MQDGLEKKELIVKWPVDSGPAIFANNVTVQADTAGMTYITFFQAIPPVIMGPDAEQQLEKLEAIEAKPVVKIVVTNQHLKRIVETLQKYIDDKT